MWKNVGKTPKRSPSESTSSAQSITKICSYNREDSKRQHKMTVDCSSSSRGLFLGIFTFVAIIISLVCFYTMIDKPQYEMEVLVISHTTELIVYTLTLCATVAAAVRMRGLRYTRKKSDKLEETLILISLFGIYLFSIFIIIPGVFHIDKLEGALSVLTGILTIIQASVQTIFIIAGMRFSARTVLQATKMPGKEFVTFLLMTNFSIWIINTLETQKPEHNVMQLQFYGVKAWSIFVHLSVPLGIFYRFHSTVCLSHVWKKAWKMK